MRTKKHYWTFAVHGVLALLLSMLLCVCIRAEGNKGAIQPKYYEQVEGADFIVDDGAAVSSFCYGANSIGSLYVDAQESAVASMQGYPVYTSNTAAEISFTYDGDHISKEATEWNLVSDSSKEIAGVQLKKKVGQGAVLVQKSIDGKTWINAASPRTDFLNNKAVGTTALYTVSDDDLHMGTYFRVFIAYEIRQKTGKKDTIGIFPEYDTRECVELYSFYICNARNTVLLRDLVTREEIRRSGDVQCGFSIDKNGSDDTVRVKRDSEAETEVENGAEFHTPGSYRVTVQNSIGISYQYDITITEGLELQNVSATQYCGDQKTAYSLSEMEKNETAKSLTTLMVAQTTGNGITEAGLASRKAYGITGSSAYLYLQLNQPESGWVIQNDEWGGKNSQLVEDTYTGRIDSGALVICTSQDGQNWTALDNGRYADGLYTTDYYENYKAAGPMLIYAPSGKDIRDGLYIRVMYAYERNRSGTKDIQRCIEKYEFYICNDSLEAVTFHNLSAKGMIKEICEEYDEATAEVYQCAETMLSGAYTTTGFTIDTSLNPAVTYTVMRNGEPLGIPASHEYSDVGKYEISLKSPLDREKIVTIYVDDSTNDTLLRLYFGESFISGKRIFDSESEYPVYESGHTVYEKVEIPENYLPVGGTITNQTTGETIDVRATRFQNSGAITTPGFYEAVFSIEPESEGDIISGDSRTFTFRFKIIENGTAPGPVVNQQSLAEYAASGVADSYPVYYGLIYQSATKGNITLAFATKEAAMEYAYNYEKGMVEVQSDGSYRYNGSFIVDEKERFDSAWDLTDAINFFAEQAVHVLYFDQSDTYTVMSLLDKTVQYTDNLRTLALDRSVYLFADGQKELLTGGDSLPIISDKPYHYLIAGENGYIDEGMLSFEFVRDKYGCDSDSVVIKDCNGTSYQIEYNQSVGQQLSKQGCPSGVITIEESTVYGDTATYQAVFIADGENTTELELAVYQDGKETARVLTQNNDVTVINGAAFSVVSITDELDPYALLLITDAEGNEYFYAADQTVTGAWSNPGSYTVKLVNRLGSSWSITVNIEESDYATILFSGDETGAAGSIVTSYGAQNVALPVLNRYGYELVGYETTEGEFFSDEIAKIQFRGTQVMKAVWQAKQYNVTLQTPDGAILDTLVLDFGKEYELPEPELENGAEFAGWQLNGVTIDSDMFVLRTEGDVTLIAAMAGALEDAPKQQENAEHKSGRRIVLVVGLAGIVGVMVLKKKNRKDNHTQPQEEETNE